MQENTKEIWRSVNGYSGLYEVSSEGRVRSLDRYANSGGGTRLYKGRILTPQKNNKGYLRIGLHRNSKSIHFFVHRLVWQAFNGQIPEGMQVNHIDEDKSNNRLDNLNLMTPKENTNYGSGIERSSKKQLNRKDCSKPIIKMDRQGNFIAEYESLMDAERNLGIYHSNIGACCKGRLKTAGGFKWTYKEQ